MNIRETIISSFFIHLILILLAMAAANYRAGLPVDISNLISVDLAPDTVKDKPMIPVPADAGPSSHEETGVPDQAAAGPSGEATEIPDSREEVTSASEPPEADKTEEPPVRKEGAASPEAYHQFILLHKRIFREQTGSRVNELLGAAFRMNKREFYGGTAMVSLKFGPDGKLNEVLVDSSSPELKAFLEEVGWGALTPPSAYLLGNNLVQIEFAVLEGYMSFNIEAL